MNYFSVSSVIFPSLTSLERQIALSPEQILAEQCTVIEGSFYFYQPSMDNCTVNDLEISHEENYTIESNNNNNSSCVALFGKKRSVDDLLS